jgi:hypothetical protein
MLLQRGPNELRVACSYHEEHPGLEIVYLLGRFGVRVEKTKPTLTAPPTSLDIGDWTRQGLTFYSGLVGYHKAIRPNLAADERLFLRVPDYRGVGVRVRVNGNIAGIIAWQPNEIDITDHLNPGANDLCIEVLGHRRNSHGPLHHRQKWPQWTGPSEFVTTENNWREGYSIVPCGLMAPPELVTRS